MIGMATMLALVLGLLGAVVVTWRMLRIRREIGGSLSGNFGVIAIDGLLLLLGLLLLVAAMSLGRRLDALGSAPEMLTMALTLLFAAINALLVWRIVRWERSS